MKLPKVPRVLPFGRYIKLAVSSDTRSIRPSVGGKDGSGRFVRNKSIAWEALAEQEQVETEFLEFLHKWKYSMPATISPTFVQNPNAPAICLTLENEAAVVILSYNHLIKPVNAALRQTYPKLVIRVRPEKSVKVVSAERKSSAQDTSQIKKDMKEAVRESVTRTDLAWEYQMPGDSSKKETWVEFAVLEYKTSNTINPEEFKSGLLGMATMPGQQRPATAGELEAYVRANVDQPSMFIGNAIPLIQTAVKYRERSRFIALFDWDTLATVRFGDTSDWPEIAFFRDEGSDTTKDLTIREGLLTFLVQALEQKTKMDGITLNSP